MEAKMMQPHHEFMAEACRLAENSPFRVSPNPRTGAVIVKNGQIAGRGRHEICGQAHAEVLAIRDAGSAAAGSDLYVTLEPCCHYGKTPPCTDLIIRSGIRRVFAGMVDPDPRVSGKGLEILRQAGIDVICGVEETRCRKLNQPFIKIQLTGMPYVIFKSAVTLDGFTADASGMSKWISSAVSRRSVHAMRAQYDAVMVGMGTVLADDPLLTVRDARGDHPARIVYDPRNRLPLTSKLAQTAKNIPLFVIVKRSSALRKMDLQNAGIHILACDGDSDGAVLKAAFRELASRGIQSVLVEGGSGLQTMLAEADLLDRLELFVAPILLGKGKKMVSLPARPMSDPTKFIYSEFKNSGPDSHFSGLLKWY